MRVEMQYTFGTDSWTSVPVAALLEILSRPPIFAIIRIAVRLRALHHKTWRQFQDRLESRPGRKMLYQVTWAAQSLMQNCP